MDPVTDVREISQFAYGFKASKALLVGIETIDDIIADLDQALDKA